MIAFIDSILEWNIYKNIMVHPKYSGLSLLVFTVGLAVDVNLTLSADHVALLAHFLDRSLDFERPYRVELGEAYARDLTDETSAGAGGNGACKRGSGGNQQSSEHICEAQHDVKNIH